MGAQNIANGSAALEPDFSANTINTTWYSNGEQLTGNNIPGTCRYDAALTPPTPAARPGYVFGGWTLRLPQCLIPVALANANNYDTSYVFYDDMGGYWATSLPDFVEANNDLIRDMLEEGLDNYSQYSDPNSYGNKWALHKENAGSVFGEALCAFDSGNGTPSDEEPYATYDPDNEVSCWCRATKYITENGDICNFSSSIWVQNGHVIFGNCQMRPGEPGMDGEPSDTYQCDSDPAEDCKHNCSGACADALSSYSYFRSAVFGANIAQ